MVNSRRKRKRNSEIPGCLPQIVSLNFKILTKRWNYEEPNLQRKRTEWWLVGGKFGEMLSCEKFHKIGQREYWNLQSFKLAMEIKCPLLLESACNFLALPISTPGRKRWRSSMKTRISSTLTNKQTKIMRSFSFTCFYYTYLVSVKDLTEL